jgi:transposase
MRPVRFDVCEAFLMSESVAIDALFWGKSMSRPYSTDLRERVIEAVESGASRREAAERFEIAPSSAVKWMQLWRATGSVAAKPSGGSISPLEEHAPWLLALIREQPDLTLNEIVEALDKRRIGGSRTAVWRFYERHKISFKKKPPRIGTNARRRGPGAPALDPTAGPP